MAGFNAIAVSLNKSSSVKNTVVNMHHATSQKYSNKFRRSFAYYILFLFSSIVLLSCNNSSSNTKPGEEKSSKEAAEDNQPAPLVIHYTIDTLKTKARLDSFNTYYSPQQRKIIAAVNRIDLNRIRTGTILSIPDTILSEFIQYTPFPLALPQTDSLEKLILIALRTQLFAAYEYGKLARFGPVNTGKKSTPTPSGLFYTNFKAKLKISTVDGEWKMPWYFNISNRGGIGMHEFQMPGYPASHSCIRMYKEDAFWIFNWAKQWVLNEDETVILQHGTPVIVFGKYNSAEPAPWRKLAEDNKALEITEAEWTEINGYLSKIIK